MTSRLMVLAAMPLMIVSVVVGISAAEVLPRKDVNLQAIQRAKTHTCHDADVVLKRQLSVADEKLDLRSEQRAAWQAFIDAVHATLEAIEMVCVERRWALDHDDPIAAFAYLEFAFAIVAEATTSFRRAAEELGRALDPIQQRIVTDTLWSLVERDTDRHAKHRTH